MKKWLKVSLGLTAMVLGACGAGGTTSQSSAASTSSAATSAATSTTAVSDAQASWDAIVEKGKLTVATAGTLYPQTYHDEDTNELTGYDVEIVKEIAKRLNLEVDFQEIGVDGQLTALDNGMVDIANFAINDEDKRVNDFLRTNPHRYSFTSMIVRASDHSGIEKWEDLAGKKAAGAAVTNYMKLAKKLGAELVVYDNVTNDVYLNDVASGRTDVIVNDYYFQTMAVKALGDKIPVVVLDGVYANPYSSSFTIKLGNDVLLEKFNEALESMRQDGTLTELSEQFFAGEDVSIEKSYDFQKFDISDVE